MKARNRNCLAAIIVVACVSVVSATIINDTAPSWRGDQNTTYQAWGFDTSANPASVEPGSYNPYGATNFWVDDVDTTFPYSGTYWKGLDGGVNDGQPGATYHSGVWRLDNSFVEIYIPNNPTQNEQKIIQLQMTYYASGTTGANPEMDIFTDPMYNFKSITQTSKTLLDVEGYYHAIWEIIIEPNPNNETLYIWPRDCTLYIDEIVIDTICIPEPITVAILGLGGLLMAVRRK